MQTFVSGNIPIRIDQHEPGGSSSKKKFPAIVLLHGSGGNVAFWLDRIAPHLQRLGIALYAVHYFDRTGTTRATIADILDGHHFPLWQSTIADALTHIAARPHIDANRIALLGISLGAFLALALAADTSAAHPSKSNHPVRAIVEISGGLSEAAHATTSFPPTLILHGDADTIVPVTLARDLDQLLTRLNVPHQTQIFSGEGHWFTPAAQLRILAAVAQFLGKHL